MFRTAHPRTAPRPRPSTAARCPECGAPVGGLAATEPGRHQFAGCGHEASARHVDALPTR